MLANYRKTKTETRPTYVYQGEQSYGEFKTYTIEQVEVAPRGQCPAYDADQIVALLNPATHSWFFIRVMRINADGSYAFDGLDGTFAGSCIYVATADEIERLEGAEHASEVRLARMLANGSRLMATLADCERHAEEDV